MKHTGLILTAFVLCLLFLSSLASCASAAEIRPLPAGPETADLDNGTFRMGITDDEHIVDGGYFIAELYLNERYVGDEVRNIVPGDTVEMNGKTWTVQKLVTHENLDGSITYEIYPEEETFGYLVFQPFADGDFISLVDDYNPIIFVGEKKIMLPLPDAFRCVWEEYNDEDTAYDMDAFLRMYNEMYGDFTPYNTSCVFEDGLLTRIDHSDYPVGAPAGEDEDPDEDYDPDESEPDSAEAVPVWKFCHGLREGLETAVITGYTIDCEEGPIPYEMTEEETENVRRIAIDGVIAGKENDMSVTGGTWVYHFETPEGKSLLSIEMYKGLIVSVDGMYRYHR